MTPPSGDTPAAVVNGAGAPPGPRHRSLVLHGVVIAGLLGLVAFVIAGMVPGSGRRLQHAATSWISIAVVLELIACTSYALLFHGVFSDGAYRISYVRGAQIGLGELGAYAAAPTGAGGPALRIWALLRSGMPFRVLMTRSVIHAAIFNLPYVMVAILLGLGVAVGVGSGDAHLALALVPLGLIIPGVSLAGVAARLARRGRGRPRSRWRRIVRDVIEAVPDGVRQLPTRMREPGLPSASVGYGAAIAAS